MTNDRGEILSFDVVVKTIIRTYEWPPSEIGGLFFDRIDYEGLLYWYDDAIEMNKEIKSQMPKK